MVAHRLNRLFPWAVIPYKHKREKQYFSNIILQGQVTTLPDGWYLL